MGLDSILNFFKIPDDFDDEYEEEYVEEPVKAKPVKPQRQPVSQENDYEEPAPKQRSGFLGSKPKVVPMNRTMMEVSIIKPTTFEDSQNICNMLLSGRPVVVNLEAMNTNMYENPITQANLQKLRDFGMEVIEPATGLLACKAVGKGKMPSEEVLLSHILQEIQYEHDMEGKRVLITAGPTREAIDPVRYLTNHSTGKMGYALAKTAARRGAKVTLVSGPCELPAPLHVDVVPVESAADMFEAVKTRAKEQDIIIKAAAVADYTPITVNTEKTKKKEGEASIALKRTTDILSWLGEHKEKGQFLCGFSMETENMLENSKKKLEKKHADMIVANNLKVAGAGFGTDTNVVTLITKEGAKELPIQTKDEVSYEILNEIMNKMA